MEMEIKNVKEVYWESTKQYDIVYGGKEYTLRKHETSNGAEAFILFDGEWDELDYGSHGETEDELLEYLWDGSFDV